MASLGNQADLDWSPWEWVASRGSWRSVGTDRNGVVIRTEWSGSGQSSVQLDSSQEPRESTSSYYSYAGASAGYQAPAETSPPRNSNAVNFPIASSGYLTAPTTREFGNVSFSPGSYQSPSGWNITHPTTGQLNQITHPSSSYPSADYNEQRPSLSYSNSQTVPGLPSDLRIDSKYAGNQNIAIPYDRSQYDSQSRHTRDFSTTPKPRQSGFEGSPSPQGDEIDMKISRILETASKGSNIDTGVVDSQEHTDIQDQDSEENSSSLNFQNTDGKDNSGNDGEGHTIISSDTSRSRRRSSTVYPRGATRDSVLPKSRNSQKYRDDLEGVTLQVEKTSLRSRTMHSSLYERSVTSTSPPQEPISRDRPLSPQKTEKTADYVKNPDVNVEHQTKHRKPHRRSSEVQQPKERPKDSSKSSGSRYGQHKQLHETSVSGEQRSRHKTSRSHHSQQQSVDRKETPLDKKFKIHGSEFFQEGAVFKTMWSEPLGEKNQRLSEVSPTDNNGAFVEDSIHQQKAYHSVRRFAVVIQKEGHCLCLPILTYGQQGTMKPGVKAEYHAIIHTGEVAPSPLNGENGLGKRPIRVDNSQYGREPLWDESRINYSKVYTIEHNIKVCFIGEIHPNSMARFQTDFEKTLYNR